MTIILVEGADKSGKTTLCDYLRAAHEARYMHSRVWRDCARWHAGIIRRALRLHEVGEIVCLDRLFISEYIYGPIFRGTAYPDEVGECLDTKLRNVGCAYVLCVPSDMPAHLARFEQSRAAGREAFDRVEQVIQRYDGLLRGNVAHPGDNFVDRFIRYGDFASDDRCVVHYDIDVHGRDMPGFVKKLLKGR